MCSFIVKIPEGLSDGLLYLPEELVTTIPRTPEEGDKFMEELMAAMMRPIEVRE